MHEEEKYLIAKLYSLAHDISITEAYDIVRETQWQINDIISGDTSYYATPEDILLDFLDLGPTYLHAFL